MSTTADLLAIYHPKAKAEIVTAYARYQAIDRENVIQDLADRFWDAVVGADWKVTSAPHRWARSLFGTRRVFLAERWRYSLIYLPDHEGRPVVLACAHDRQERGYWRDRLPDVS